MNSWVPLVPEYITSTADRDPTSLLSSFASWSSSAINLSDYEVKFYLGVAAGSAEDVFIVNGSWTINLGSPNPEEKPEASVLGLPLGSTYAEVGPISADQGPFYLVHSSTAGGPQAVNVRTAIRKSERVR